MRSIAACLLICAAGLTTSELLSGSGYEGLDHLHLYAAIARIVGEFGFGAYLLSGVYAKASRWLGGLLFVALAIYSFWMAMSGAESCGCFGPIHIHPWWTFFIDLAVSIGIFIGPRERSMLSNASSHHFRLISLVRFSKSAIVITNCVLLATAVLWARNVRNEAAADSSFSQFNQSLSILQPQKWIGKQLPISRSIDVDVSKGDWHIVLHRSDCPACQAAIPHFENLASHGTHVALIEIPPYGSSESHGNCVDGHLFDDRTWFVRTPIEIDLHDGKVIAIDDNLMRYSSAESH